MLNLRFAHDRCGDADASDVCGGGDDDDDVPSVGGWKIVYLMPTLCV